jgi:hypothetical protein
VDSWAVGRILLLACTTFQNKSSLSYNPFKVNVERAEWYVLAGIQPHDWPKVSDRSSKSACVRLAKRPCFCQFVHQSAHCALSTHRLYNRPCPTQPSTRPPTLAPVPVPHLQKPRAATITHHRSPQCAPGSQRSVEVQHTLSYRSTCTCTAPLAPAEQNLLGQTLLAMPPLATRAVQLPAAQASKHRNTQLSMSSCDAWIQECPPSGHRLCKV